MVGGEVLGPRPARDGEDRLEVEGVRAAERLLVVVAREEEAQERAAEGWAPNLFMVSGLFSVAGAVSPNLGRFAARLLVWRKNAA